MIEPALDHRTLLLSSIDSNGATDVAIEPALDRTEIALDSVLNRTKALYPLTFLCPIASLIQEISLMNAFNLLIDGRQLIQLCI